MSKDRCGSRFIYCIQITRTVSIFYTLAKMEMTQEHVEMEKLINKEDEGRQPTLPNKKGWLAIFILYRCSLVVGAIVIYFVGCVVHNNYSDKI